MTVAPGGAGKLRERTSGTNRVRGLALRGKQDNLAGLQVADLVVTPIGRSLLGKSSLVDYGVIQSKFRCNHRKEYGGVGLVVLPKN